MLTVYEKILYHAATKNIVPKSVMMILCSSFSPIYRAVNRGIELGYLEERTITVESDGRKYKEDFLIITNDGINYISSVDQPETSWLPIVPPDAKVIGARILGSSRVRRYLNITASVIVAEEIGIPVAPIFFDIGNIPGETFVRDVIEAAYENRQINEDSMQIINDTNNKDDLLERIDVQPEQDIDNIGSLQFCTALDAKRLISSSEADYSGYDVSRGKYTGVFYDNSSIVVCYTCLKGKFIFSENEVRQNKIIHVNFPRPEGYAEGDSKRSVLLVDSSKIFRNSFFNLDYMKKKKFNELFTGSDLDEFCVFPLTHFGILSLREYLLHEDHEKDILDTAIASGRFELNNRKYSEKLFPLIREDNIPVMIGTKIDVIKIFAMENLAKKYPEEVFGVICYDWQIEYYEKTGINLRITALRTT